MSTAGASAGATCAPDEPAGPALALYSWGAAEKPTSWTLLEVATAVGGAAAGVKVGGAAVNPAGRVVRAVLGWVGPALALREAAGAKRSAADQAGQRGGVGVPHSARSL